jgi:hypothetical protein
MKQWNPEPKRRLSDFEFFIAILVCAAIVALCRGIIFTAPI